VVPSHFAITSCDHECRATEKIGLHLPVKEELLDQRLKHQERRLLLLLRRMRQQTSLPEVGTHN
jgi:hypothetical protein